MKNKTLILKYFVVDLAMTEYFDYLGLEKADIQKLNKINDIFKKSVVSFDIDQVEADSATCALNRVNSLLGSNYTPADLKSYWGLTSLIKRDFTNITAHKFCNWSMERS